jgi:hypothetical protein
MPQTDLLVADETNPFVDHDLLYVPYCDGSLFVGDVAIDEDDDGAPDRIQRGLANLSAALTAGYPEFPDPSKIVLVGSSGGGYGTILAVFLVRYVYPDVPIVVINDAGVGVAHPEDPGFDHELLVEFGARAAVPADCPDCIADGNVTRLVRYALDRDPGVRIAALTSEYDFVISKVFLKVPAATFRQNLVAATDEIRAAHPDRYRRFMWQGDAHTATLGELSAFVGVDVASVEIPQEALEGIGNIRLESIHTASARGAALEPWLRAFVDGTLDGAPDLVSDPSPLPTWAKEL